jgi:Amt family ammonium transporter
VREEFVKAYGADGVRGILYGDPGQLVMQIISAVTVAVFGFVMAWVWFKISDKITPLRTTEEIELEGQDIGEMGVLAYPDFQVHTGSRLRE